VSAPGRAEASRRLAAAAVAIFAIAAGACSRGFGRGHANADLDVAVPDSFVVRFETSRGSFDVMARKAWAPNGADRLYTLVRDRYYDDARFFRVVKDFVAQFGLAADPRRTAAWRVRAIADEPVRHSNLRGTISYARGGPGTRTTQLYINLKDNARLDTLNGFGFPPVAEVIAGMSVVDSLYSGYGEAARPGGRGQGPSQDSINRQGNAYLTRGFPKLDYVRSARVTREWRGPAATGR
jgi:cyclophilin family peptidyl-prolyl cis-trans isomerase